MRVGCLSLPDGLEWDVSPHKVDMLACRPLALPNWQQLQQLPAGCLQGVSVTCHLSGWQLTGEEVPLFVGQATQRGGPLQKA